MRIAVAAESLAGERRVAASPETVKKFIAQGIDVVVQQGAGDQSAFVDAAYADVGATLATSFAELCAGADVLLKVQPLRQQELADVAAGCIVVSLLSPFTNSLLQAYVDAKISYLGLELVPRISRAQSMDVLSSQANIAGYKAVLLACEHYPRFFPMLMTAAGTVQSANVLVLGTGVAGLQAIATARRLGARVEAFDVRPAAREQVESLGAVFVEVESEESAETEGGYAKEMSDEYKRKQSELVAKHAAKADIIITTALIPGRPAPVLIVEDVLKQMRQGSVIVDLAVEMGGNCPLSEKGRVVQKHGVTLVGESNIPSLMAADASGLFARNVFALMALLHHDDGFVLNTDDEIIDAALFCHAAELRKPQFIKES